MKPIDSMYADFTFTGPDGLDWDVDAHLDVRFEDGKHDYYDDTLYVSRVDPRNVCKRIDAHEAIVDYAAELIRSGQFIDLIEKVEA